MVNSNYNITSLAYFGANQNPDYLNLPFLGGGFDVFPPQQPPYGRGLSNQYEVWVINPDGFNQWKLNHHITQLIDLIKSTVLKVSDIMSSYEKWDLRKPLFFQDFQVWMAGEDPQASLKQRIKNAFQNNNIEELNELINTHELDVKNLPGLGDLFIKAIETDKLELLDFCIEKGFNIKEKLSNGLYPIQFAVLTKSLNIFNFLYEEKCFDNLTLEEKCWVVTIIARNNSPDFLEHLHTKNVLSQIIQEASNTSFNPFHIAASEGRLNIVKFFVENVGVDPKASFIAVGQENEEDEKDGLTIAHIAARYGKIDILGYLKSKNLNLSGFISTLGNNIFGCAASFKGLDSIKYLFENEFDIFKMNLGEIVLRIISSNENMIEKIKFLISNKIDLQTIRTSDEKTLLHLAVIFNNPDLYQFLIEKGFDCNIQDIGGASPIHLIYALLQHYLDLREQKSVQADGAAEANEPANIDKKISVWIQVLEDYIIKNYEEKSEIYTSLSAVITRCREALQPPQNK